jgi:protocatechuate 3,4-dioxygenase beta subunit
MAKRHRYGVSRRNFIRLALIGAPSLTLAACGEPTTVPAVTTSAATSTTSAPTTAVATTAPAVTTGAPTTSAVPTPTVAPATVAPSATPVPATPTTAPATTTAVRTTAPAATTSAPVTTVASSGASQVLAPTPECLDADDLTVAQTEGPYYTPSTPQRKSLLEPGMAGTKLTITGFVLTTDCKPIKGAWLDFWQADAAGQYDNRGFRLRGHQYTDDNGRYTLETVMPGEYPGRTIHIHVKAKAPTGSVLTTQLYFPGARGNATDGIYRASLEMKLADEGNAKKGSFDFVLRT